MGNLVHTEDAKLVICLDNGLSEKAAAVAWLAWTRAICLDILCFSAQLRFWWSVPVGCLQERNSSF
jgi:hypothetical protein